MEPAHERWMSNHWRVEEVDDRKLASLASQITKSRELAVGLVDDFKSQVSHRNMVSSDTEVSEILLDLHEKKQLEVEMDVFRLSE